VRENNITRHLQLKEHLVLRAKNQEKIAELNRALVYALELRGRGCATIVCLLASLGRNSGRIEVAVSSGVNYPLASALEVMG
jgi:hypothetical protein